MAKQNILLGGIVKDEVAKVNANFTELYENMPTKTSDLTNDSNFVTSSQMTSAITAATDAIDVPSKTSDLTNDSNFVTSAQMTNAVANKVDKVAGKDLSTNDYDDTDKAKVDNLDKIEFTTSSFSTSGDYQVATLSAAGKYPVKVLRQNGSTYDEVIAQTTVSGNNIVITSSEAFSGYVLTV